MRSSTRSLSHYGASKDEKLTYTHPKLILFRRFIFALVLSLYNKWMFAPDHFGFPLPLFVTMLHMLVQSVLASILRFGWPRRFRPDHDPSKEDYV